MRIPFPYSLRVGTDIVHLSRLSKSETHFRKLVLRILHPSEQQTLNNRFPHWLDQTAPKGSIRDQKRRDWLGGRWAAKEAAKKAWGASLLSFKDLRVEVAQDGDLQIICAPFDEVKPDRPCGEQVAQLSISHDGEYAIATVLASPLHKTLIAELGHRKAEAKQKMTPLVDTKNDAPP